MQMHYLMSQKISLFDQILKKVYDTNIPLFLQALLPFLSVFRSIFFTYFWYYSVSTLKSATCIKSFFLKHSCKSSKLTLLNFSLVVLECAVKPQPT